MSDEVNLAGIVQQMHQLVSTLSPEQRSRVMRSVSALFPEVERVAAFGAGAESGGSAAYGEIPVAATKWLTRNGVTPHHLEQVFHFEAGKVTVIADVVPGNTKREQTVSCYALEGARAFLETGVAKFADADADALCERIGCRDKTNHSANRSSAGNKMTGSRSDGFTLVAPGLIHAAKLIKEIAGPDAPNVNK